MSRLEEVLVPSNAEIPTQGHTNHEESNMAQPKGLVKLW